MNKLKISPEARNDLVEIKNYISQELNNMQAAVNLMSKITKKIRGLQEHPKMGAALFPAIDVQTDYRFLVCEGYLIFYRHENDAIYVVRILYGRRDYMRIIFSDLPEGENRI